MRKTAVSSALTVYHDGQFWVGVAERVEAGRLSACRLVFGAEPSDEEILGLVATGWERLPFSDSEVACEPPKVATNPKRRQRDAARQLKERGSSTKAQQALSEQREALALQRKAEARDTREGAQRRRYELRKADQKRRHRGK